MHKYECTYTDTFAGEINCSWVRRASVTMPDLTVYGYTGSADGSYTRANRTFQREIMRKAKAEFGLTGVRGRTYSYGDNYEFRPYGMATALLVSYIG